MPKYFFITIRTQNKSKLKFAFTHQNTTTTFNVLFLIIFHISSTRLVLFRKNATAQQLYAKAVANSIKKAAITFIPEISLSYFRPTEKQLFRQHYISLQIPNNIPRPLYRELHHVHSGNSSTKS